MPLPIDAPARLRHEAALRVEPARRHEIAAWRDDRENARGMLRQQMVTGSAQALHDMSERGEREARGEERDRYAPPRQPCRH